MLLALWFDFWNWESGNEKPTTGGADYSEHDYKKYRSHLEKLIESTSHKEIEKPKTLKKIAKIAKVVNVQAPEIQKAIEPNYESIDYGLIDRELNKILIVLNQIILMERLKQEQDDEFALLMMIG